MDVRNCKSCNKVFNFLGGQPICPVFRKAVKGKARPVSFGNRSGVHRAGAVT